jgi:hypothetical protein
MTKREIGAASMSLMAPESRSLTTIVLPQKVRVTQVTAMIEDMSHVEEKPPRRESGIEVTPKFPKTARRESS